MNPIIQRAADLIVLDGRGKIANRREVLLQLEKEFPATRPYTIMVYTDQGATIRRKRDGVKASHGPEKLANPGLTESTTRVK
ncbi:MAG: hypothetical protein WCE68_00320 [Anaerolineales bacterium]